MIARDQLSDDAADWVQVQVSLPRLNEDTADACPASLAELMDYVRMESGDTADAETERLTFLRTAKIGKSSYWLWTYTEKGGDSNYVVFRENPDGSTELGLSGPNGLSPEQYLLADYYDEVYWS
jgi:hypothetical protein